jgi:thiamine pyrophosphate-dependent acetolactate synthase large subunit-like protein
MAPEQTCGEALVKLLERRGVDTVFGIPGVHTLDLYRGLSRSSIRHVLVRHEQGAGFMADGYARISGRPGVCFVITGPGVTNIATAMGQAYSDSIPMLVISTVRSTADLNNNFGRLHEIVDQRSVTEQLCAFSATAMSPGQVPELIDKAFAVFESARPRPVHIEIPLDVVAMAVTEDWQPGPSASKPVPEPDQLASAAALLGDAAMPVIIAGGGARDGGESLTQLAELLGAPVITTVAGKGLMPHDHPLHLPCTLAHAETQELLAEADVVLALGTELAETDSWVDHLSIPGAIVRVDIDPEQVKAQYAPAIGIIGDAAVALAALVNLLSDKKANDVRAMEERVRNMRKFAADNETDLRQTHRRVLQTLHGALPETATVFTDMTQIAYSGNEIFPAGRPKAWFHPRGFGTLGFAMPAAIGAKLASPATPMVALAGDGGFQFTLQELAVAVELELNMAIILWNNDAFGQIRDDMVDRGIEKVGVEMLNPDFKLLAEAYGAHYLRPDALDDLASDVAQALEGAGVWLIDVRQATFSER